MVLSDTASETFGGYLGDNAPMPHYHMLYDYSTLTNSMVSNVTANGRTGMYWGDAFWSDFYSGYSGINYLGGCTVNGICASYAFNGYLPGAVAEFWPAYAGEANATDLYLGELGYVSDGTIGQGSICVAPEDVHIWYITDTETDMATMVFKNGASGIVGWTEETDGACPTGGWSGASIQTISGTSINISATGGTPITDVYSSYDVYYGSGLLPL